MKVIKTSSVILTIIALFLNRPAKAEEQYSIVNPAELRMSNYKSDGIAFFNAGTPCWQGQALGGLLSPSDKNRLVAVYLTGLVAKKKIYFQYDPKKDCQITVFGIDKQ